MAATDPIECKLVAAVFSVLGFMFNMVASLWESKSSDRIPAKQEEGTSVMFFF